MTLTTRTAPLTSAALALVAAGSLLLFSIVAQQTALQLPTAAPVTPIGPPSDGGGPITLLPPPDRKSVV